MKKLTIEQKAQRYNEALKVLHKYDGANIMFSQSLKEEMFPELKESEDERIRKGIIEYLRQRLDRSPSIPAAIGSWIAWLEKQGEQKSAIYDSNVLEKHITKNSISELANSILIRNGWKVIEQNLTDKAEPKFHEGEWLCENEPNNYARFIQILNVQGKERYRISRDIHNDKDIVEFDFVEKYYHKFDIKDAKPGDVLASKNGAEILIFRKLDSSTSFSSYYNIKGRGEIGWSNRSFVPATKEQRDLLFQKMKEAGYEWDFEKKELKKIENKNPLLSDFFKAEYERGKADAQKPDGCSENKRLHTINVYYPNCCLDVKEAIEQGIACCKTEKKEILISLNGIFLRITPSSTTENVLNEYNNCTGNSTVIKDKTNLINQWNSNDDSYLKGIITDIECEVSCANCSREIADLKINWLKSLKGRVQPQVEWGEWGKKYIASTIKMVEHCSFSSIGGITKVAAITWLKSLGPQTIWKPSDEQMKILNEVLNFAANHESPYWNDYIFGTLNNLIRQLKKLME